MRREFGGAYGLAVATLILVSSCGNRDGNNSNTVEAPAPAPTTSPTSLGLYSPRDDGAEAWGAFDFYRTHATLAAFQGHLTLEAAGNLPASAGETLAGASVYKIVNAQEFHDTNKNRDVRCLAPALWLAVKPIDGGAHVALLTLQDWKVFEPKKPGLCGSGTYDAQ
jgi:hypothetical protein